MNRTQVKRYEMLVRVSQFGNTNRQQFPESSPAGQAFAAVRDAVAQIDAHAKAKLLTREEGKKARAAVRDAIEDRVKTIARIARVVGRSEPGADSKFKLPMYRSAVALVTAARAYADAGASVVERFVPFGLPATIVAELQDLVARYDQADRERRAGKDGFAKARAGTAAAFAAVTEPLRVLDVVVPATFASDPAQLGAWHEARRRETTARAARVRKSKAARPSSSADSRSTPDAAVDDGPGEAGAGLRKVS